MMIFFDLKITFTVLAKVSNFSINFKKSLGFNNLHGRRKIRWSGTPCINKYNSSFRKSLQVTYETVGVVQMTFLRLLSEEAYQNFTYTCINSVAWYNMKSRKYDLSIKLLGENEQEFSHLALKPYIIADGCKTRKSKGETIFEIRTQKLSQLPIIDFYPVDYGMPNQAFGFSIGPVCFR